MSTVKKSYILLFISSIITNSETRAHGFFDTLHFLQQYAHNNPENPLSDTINWAQPDYSSFYQRYSPSLWSRVLTSIGLKKPLWRPKRFKDLLFSVLLAREKTSYHQKHVLGIIPREGTRFVIWTDLQGAFHSLVRDLTELNKKDIINKNLEIIAPDIYFVFNGNVVNRSAYILETLAVVLQLMKKNPDRVIYICGSGEDKEKWFNFGTKEELKAKLTALSNDIVPLADECRRLFATLPVALYLVAKKEKTQIKVVRIANYKKLSQYIDERYLGDFFITEKSNIIIPYNLENKNASVINVDLVASIMGKNNSFQYVQTTGLTKRGLINGAMTWSLLSSPTLTYQHLYNFFWDAFVVLDCKDDWSISLYNQDVRNKQGFKRAKNFKLISGLLLPVDKKQTARNNLLDTKKTVQSTSHNKKNEKI